MWAGGRSPKPAPCRPCDYGTADRRITNRNGPAGGGAGSPAHSGVERTECCRVALKCNLWPVVSLSTRAHLPFSSAPGSHSRTRVNLVRVLEVKGAPCSSLHRCEGSIASFWARSTMEGMPRSCIVRVTARFDSVIIWHSITTDGCICQCVIIFLVRGSLLY